MRVFLIFLIVMVIYGARAGSRDQSPAVVPVVAMVVLLAGMLYQFRFV